MGIPSAIAAAFIKGFDEIATKCSSTSKSAVFKNDTGTAVAFLTKVATISGGDHCLSLLGVAKVSETSQYIDLRARDFLGEVPSGWDYRWGLQENHNSASDARLGICSYEGKEILTITDNYRYSMLWEPEEIFQIMEARHLMQFISHDYRAFGVNPIPDAFLLEMLKKEGFMKLMSLRETDLITY